MMTNLFSIFDPSTDEFLFSMNWINLILPLFLIPLNFWFTPSRFNFIWIKIISLILNEFKMLIKINYISNMIIFISLMLTILLLNSMSLMPYIFTSTSHMSMNLSLSLPLWIGYMYYGWYYNMNKMFIHLVPMNTPYTLMNFMVIIESISNIIRPWTLSIRLTANLLAGHLLLSLLGNSMKFILIIPILIIIQNMLFLLEISVAMIQSYVFSILNVLYFNESN